MFTSKPKLFNPPKIDYPIYDLHLNFLDYIEQSKRMIADTRIDLETYNKKKIIEANAPFELRPETKDNKKGVLLIHGLLDSAFQMREIGEHLQSQGFLVR